MARSCCVFVCRQEDVEQSLKNVANHLFTIDVGMSYVHENITEEEPVDFMIDKVPVSSGIGILCDRVEHECSNFIAEIDQLIRVSILFRPCTYK